MTFSRSCFNNFFGFNINYIPRITNVIKDLRIYFEPTLTFNGHNLHIKNKALKLLGFICRSCVDFNEKNTFIKIYCSLVRLILEYVFIMRSPYNTGLIIILEKVQNKFLRFLAFKCNIT
jgi:hypothetical protein